MSIANPNHLPLYEKLSIESNIRRAMFLIILFLYVSLLFYRLQTLKQHGVPWLLAFLCESYFTFLWLISTSNNWNPVDYKTYPDRLLNRSLEHTPLDVFVTTADPVIEPPIITVNTVLSFLALDYPANKLACYVSDDAASPITLYSLVEAVEFAKLWVPFCKKHNIQVRAPFRYLSYNQPNTSPEFYKEWRKMKDEYEILKRKIEEAERNIAIDDLTGKYETFSKFTRGDHPSIVKVIWEKKEGVPYGLPHLVYVAREKRPKHRHNFKAGAMNVLTRVSGVMTNAPYTLNVDCDMFANNPQIGLHGMCILLDTANERQNAFIQCPQLFYEGIKDDPFGNQCVVWQKYFAKGVAGIQGPSYHGTGCFHRRKVLYGLSPKEVQADNRVFDKGESVEEVLKARLGGSEEFVKSAELSISKSDCKLFDSISNPSCLKAATLVAERTYESNTNWGTKVGWVYGSATEDVLTGQNIHAKGWSSAWLAPDPAPFLGCAPRSGPVVMVQTKRWAIGLLEILLSRKNPIFATITGKLGFRQCLMYISIYTWGLGSVPKFCYAILSAYCLLSNTSFMPMVREPATLIVVPLFLLYNMLNLLEYLSCGLSFRAWWNNRRMYTITSATSRLFGFLSVILKLLGLSETVFEVTPKDQNSLDDGVDPDPGRFTFDASPIFVPATTLVMVHIAALGLALVRIGSRLGSCTELELVELMCSVWVVVSLMPFVKGLFRKGKYGIPSSTLFTSAALAGLFVACIFGFQRDSLAQKNY